MKTRTTQIAKNHTITPPLAFCLNTKKLCPLKDNVIACKAILSYVNLFIIINLFLIMFLYPQKIFSQAKLVKNRFKDHTNPNKGTFSIRYNEKADFTISVINSVGIEVFRAHIKSNTEISMPEHIISGIYYVKVESNNTLPVIKKISIIK